VANEGVAFSQFLEFPVDPITGNVTVLSSLDDKLVIFKRDAIYTLSGDGPVDTGAQNDYGAPQKVSGEIGCQNPRSVAVTPDGVMFQSDKGIYLLDRSLGLSYIGADVADYNGLTITSAVVLEDVNEVRFTTEDGPCLVYNYLFRQWSTFSNYEAVSAITLGGKHYHLKSDGSVFKESEAYLDNGAKIKMTIETSWLAVAGIQGFQRLKEWSMLGDYITDHYTKVKLFYDYEDYASETVYFNVDEDLDISYYGEGVYGSTSIYGSGSSSVYQFSHKPRRQKCQSVKLRIEDIDTKVLGGGGSFNLVALSMDVGVKGGISKTIDRGN
jgi:hypothetical protein